MPTPDLRQTLTERGKTHGDFTHQAAVAQDLKDTIRNYRGGVPFSHLDRTMQEGIDMICHKLSRIITGDPRTKDHWVDIAGYATITADRIPDLPPAATKENVNGSTAGTHRRRG